MNGDGATGAATDTARAAEDEEAASRPSFMSRIFGLGADAEEIGDPPERDPDHTEADRAAGEREMLVNVRKLRDLRVVDVMVPRADVSGVEIDVDLADLLDVFRETQHTRLPVYADTLDDPQGFVHLKDVALGYGFGADNGTFDLRALLRPILYAPPSMPIDALLQKMQRQRVHLALVIDEYGGVDGLLTIEDLLEQIVGEIADEHDVADDATFREVSPGLYSADARVEVPDFEATAGVDLLSDDLDEDVDTLGGLVVMLAGRVPERGEVITHPDGHEFEVLDADPRRIKRLRVRLSDAEAAPRAAQ
jgi:magnesium and cobalt transporter